MVDRILKIIRQKNLTPSQFADEIGVQRSGMSHLLSGRNKPSLEFVLKVLKRYPEITADWLLYGDQTAKEKGAVKETESTMPEIPLDWDAAAKIEVEDVKKGGRPVHQPGQAKKIEKIVILYRDRTFREYLPDSGL